MRPVTCGDCQGLGIVPFTTRKLTCQGCEGQGIRLAEGHDPWARYRAHFGIEVTPARLAMEESLDEAGL